MRAKPATFLGVMVLLAGACGGVTTPTPGTTPTAEPLPTATATAVPVVTVPPSPPTTPPPLPSAPASSTHPSTAGMGAGSLPVRANASEVGADVRMAGRLDGGLFVAIPADKDTVLVSLDEEGRVRQGWPVILKRATSCEIDADPADGSARAVCRVGETKLRAFGLATDGRPMPGWPVDLTGRVASWRSDPARIVDGVLYVVLFAGSGDDTAALVRVARDGSLRTGSVVRGKDLVGCCASVGPDGTGHVVHATMREVPGTTTWEHYSVIWAFDLDGVRTGYPVRVDGWASMPVYGRDGRTYVVVDDTAEGETAASSPVFAFARNGETITGWPVRIPGDTATGSPEGVTPPRPPLAPADGSVRVVTGVVHALGPTGEDLPGWPYDIEGTLATAVAGVGPCPYGCGSMCGIPPVNTPPLVGPDDAVYLAVNTAGDVYAGGNRIVAVGTNGKVRAGWPVTLVETGAWFGTFIVVADGRVYGFAVEPAGTRPTDCGTKVTVHSGTVVAFDGHGDPIYTTTLVVP